MVEPWLKVLEEIVVEGLEKLFLSDAAEERVGFESQFRSLFV